MRQEPNHKVVRHNGPLLVVIAKPERRSENALGKRPSSDVIEILENITAEAPDLAQIVVIVFKVIIHHAPRGVSGTESHGEEFLRTCGAKSDDS